MRGLETLAGEPPEGCQDPREVPLLRDLLASAAENRRLREGTLRRRVEADADFLHEALGRQVAAAEQRLRASKLAAMAEFAAGAGHEINNPLAVISGQAQYVLAHAAQWFTAEACDGPRKSLQAVITQTKRIHNLLRDLMQFARPSPPRPTWFDLTELLAESAASVRDLAEQRHVRLEVQSGQGQVSVRADREQVKTALAHVLRNAVEAAPAEGWARAVLQAPAADRVALAVEDSGPGPDETKRDHLFDPFYSGRCAGRGRGLGLPTRPERTPRHGLFSSCRGRRHPCRNSRPPSSPRPSASTASASMAATARKDERRWLRERPCRRSRHRKSDWSAASFSFTRTVRFRSRQATT